MQREAMWAISPMVMSVTVGSAPSPIDEAAERTSSPRKR